MTPELAHEVVLIASFVALVGAMYCMGRAERFREEARELLAAAKRQNRATSLREESAKKWEQAALAYKLDGQRYFDDCLRLVRQYGMAPGAVADPPARPKN